MFQTPVLVILFMYCYYYKDPACGLFACPTQLKECYATYWAFELIPSSSFFLGLTSVSV